MIEHLGSFFFLINVLPKAHSQAPGSLFLEPDILHQKRWLTTGSLNLGPRKGTQLDILDSN